MKKEDDVAVKILHMLVTPFTDTQAYHLGIIDDHGKELKSYRKLKTATEKSSYSYLNRVVFGMKRVIDSTGSGNNVKNLAAAMFLVKESMHTPTIVDVASRFVKLQEKLDKYVVTLSIEEDLIKKALNTEDAPANHTGAAVSTDQPITGSLVQRRKKLVVQAKGDKPC